jgi:hypothetical protein
LIAKDEGSGLLTLYVALTSSHVIPEKNREQSKGGSTSCQQTQNGTFDSVTALEERLRVASAFRSMM